jgi:hypothetical protein
MEKNKEKFLSRDPEKALFEVKEQLYERLRVLYSCIMDPPENWDDIDIQMNNEIQFISKLLDVIERS